ncbi:MAG: DNA-directed RNA polymerase specialized sigma24 family protein [Planctomycetota bacterium]|jgi:DNA-directed RNA polymerase specialized sigma24 family protein
MPQSEQFLADAAWLDRVAHGLIQDPATVDDLLQDT